MVTFTNTSYGIPAIFVGVSDSATGDVYSAIAHPTKNGALLDNTPGNKGISIITIDNTTSPATFWAFDIGLNAWVTSTGGPWTQEAGVPPVAPGRHIFGVSNITGTTIKFTVNPIDLLATSYDINYVIGPVTNSNPPPAGPTFTLLVNVPISSWTDNGNGTWSYVLDWTPSGVGLTQNTLYTFQLIPKNNAGSGSSAVLAPVMLGEFPSFSGTQIELAEMAASVFALGSQLSMIAEDLNKINVGMTQVSTYAYVSGQISNVSSIVATLNSQLSTLVLDYATLPIT
jgi:hypothetical protein